MRTLGPPSNKLSASEHGFVLPFVLLTVAAISLIAISSYNALSKSANYMRLLQQTSTAQIALATAEAETTYRFLISIGDIGSMRIPDPNAPLSADAFFLDSEPIDPTDENYWDANGGVKQSTTKDTPVLVSYRDISGFAPINRYEEVDLVNLFEFSGFAPADATKLAAELADFIDSDTERRFRGGERPDYRIYGIDPPTDSPIRNAVEIANLLSIPKDLGDAFWKNFAEITTVYMSTNTVKPSFASPVMEALVNASADSEFQDDIQQLIASDRRLKERARFLLTLPGADGASRTVEIEKSANNVQKPFKRYLVSERTGSRNFGEPKLGDVLQTELPEEDSDLETQNSDDSPAVDENDDDVDDTSDQTRENKYDYPLIIPALP